MNLSLAVSPKIREEDRWIEFSRWRVEDCGLWFSVIHNLCSSQTMRRIIFWNSPIRIVFCANFVLCRQNLVAALFQTYIITVSTNGWWLRIKTTRGVVDLPFRITYQQKATHNWKINYGRVRGGEEADKISVKRSTHPYERGVSSISCP